MRRVQPRKERVRACVRVKGAVCVRVRRQMHRGNVRAVASQRPPIILDVAKMCA